EIDPWDHIITTSARNEDSEIWELPEIEVVQIHNYSGEVVSTLRGLISKQRRYDKPVLVGEFGLDAGGENNAEDAEGTHLHNGIWSSLFSGSGAMLWWWDSYIEQNNLYYHFKALSEFLKGEKIPPGGFREIKPEVKGGPPNAEGLIFSPMLGWEASTQSEFTIEADGSVPGIENLSRYIQGYWHSDMGREVLFHVTTRDSGFFSIYISEFSYQPVLNIYIDDFSSPVYSKQVTSTGTVEVPIPPGYHNVYVYNSGNDWIKVDYFQFTGFYLPAAQAFAMVSDNKVLLWIKDRGNKFKGTLNGLISGTSISIYPMSGGEYGVEFFDTYKGEILSAETVITSGDSLNIEIPPFERDMAVKADWKRASGIRDKETIPSGYRLFQNRPNPFNSMTQIRYYLPAEGRVNLSIFNIKGEKIAEPVNRRQQMGYHTVEWYGKDGTGRPVSSGVYFYRLKTGNKSLIRKLVLIR
ncbi:MAG: T9SS type A sorting domain-containing protein, partial [Fidelibacterota bacterium]